MMMAMPKLNLPETSLDPGQKLHYGIFSLVSGKMAQRIIVGMKERAVNLYEEIKLLNEDEDAKLLCLVTPEAGGNSSREHAIDTQYEGNHMSVGMLRDRAKRHIKTS